MKKGRERSTEESRKMMSSESRDEYLHRTRVIVHGL
jgi:hypothetical protein